MTLRSRPVSLLPSCTRLSTWRRQSSEGVDISEDQLSLVIRAVEHYADYLKATGRDDRLYRNLADSLKRKQPESETTTVVKKAKRRA